MKFRFSAGLTLAATLIATLLSFSTAHAADTIVVGRSLPLTGALASYGEAKRDGGDAYIKKVNSAGGVGGRAIELITIDDVYLPATTVLNLKKIATDNKPVAFLGLFGVPTVAAALPVLEELKIPGVGLTSGADAVRAPFKRYAFPVRASYAAEARKLVEHVQVGRLSKVSIIYSDNPFGESVKNSLVAALKVAGFDAALVKVDPAGKTAAEAAKLANAGKPQAVFLTMLSQAAVPTLIELKAANYYGALYTFSPVDTTTVANKLGEKAQGLAITQIVPIPSGIRLKVVAEYLQAMKDLGRGAPSFYGLEAYIEAKVLVEGLKRAGSRPSPESLVKALETMGEYDLGGYFVSYGPNVRTGSLFVEVDVINASGQVIR